jgi:hypothetical protein
MSARVGIAELRSAGQPRAAVPTRAVLSFLSQKNLLG